MDTEILRLANLTADLLIETNQTIGIAESSSGGLISAHLLAIPGASKFFMGGSVIYTRVAQRNLLGVNDEEMEGLRASTEQYASLNAKTIRELLGTTWGLSETGATGPTGNRYGDSASRSGLSLLIFISWIEPFVLLDLYVRGIEKGFSL